MRATPDDDPGPEREVRPGLPTVAARRDELPGDPRVVLLGRPGCHLCEEAREVVDRVATDLGVAWEERSIDDDPDLVRRFGEQIPVTFVDGRRHDFWRVDEARLRAALG